MVVAIGAAVSASRTACNSCICAKVTCRAVSDCLKDMAAALIHLDRCWLDGHRLPLQLLDDMILAHVRSRISFSLDRVVRFITLTHLVSRQIGSLLVEGQQCHILVLSTANFCE